MKKSDISMMVVAGVLGFLLTILICNVFLKDPSSARVTFKTVDVISSELEDPDPEVFNDQAINPTVEVYTAENGQNSSTEEGE